MKISRRKVIKYGLVGSLALVAGGLSLSLQSTKMITPPEALYVLNVREYSILYAIAERLIPANGNFKPASALGIAEKVDVFLAYSHPGVQKEFKQVLNLFENASLGLLFSGTFKPFSQYDPDTQDEIIEGWRSSRLHFRRTVFMALNRLCGAVYYAQPESFAILGYSGPPPAMKQMHGDMGDAP